MSKTLIAFVILCCSCICCSEEASAAPGEPTTPPANQAEEPDATPAATAAVHHAMCGCSVEGVDKCGNYIEIEGEYVHLENPSLGEMEFCAHKGEGVDVEVVGAMDGDKFVAESWKIVQ